MKLIKIPFPENEYIKVPQTKTQIVLHHTVSSQGQFVDDWWKADNGKSRVATAFILEKDGTLLQLFEPQFWAYHIGQGSTVQQNQRSIGIEIVNEGALTLNPKDNLDPLQKILPHYAEPIPNQNKNPDNIRGQLYWFDGKHKFTGEFIVLPQEWRGTKYFPKYTEAQYDTLNTVLPNLCSQFNIPKQIAASYRFDEKYRNLPGIVCHHNLRKDKSDVSKAFDFTKLNGFILLDTNS